MSRARNGSGTVTQRADGRWMGRLRLDGERHTVYGRTKKEAAEKLDGLRRQALVLGGLPGRQTLDELLDRWLSTASGGLKPATLARYRRSCSMIRRRFGEVPLAKVTAS